VEQGLKQEGNKKDKKKGKKSLTCREWGVDLM